MLALSPLGNPGNTWLRIVDDGSYVGTICIHTEYEKGVGEIGYCIGEEHRGKGYCKAALALALAEWCKTGWHTIMARVYHTNEASVRVLLANGFVEREAPLYDRYSAFLYFERSLNS